MEKGARLLSSMHMKSSQPTSKSLIPEPLNTHPGADIQHMLVNDLPSHLNAAVLASNYGSAAVFTAVPPPVLRSVDLV